MHKQQLYKKVMEKYGLPLQIIVAIEEMSELQKELCKELRDKDDKLKIAEEIADVEIMLEQLKYRWQLRVQVEKFKFAKLERLQQRLKND